jgi:hypothetical protein
MSSQLNKVEFKTLIQQLPGILELIVDCWHSVATAFTYNYGAPPVAKSTFGHLFHVPKFDRYSLSNWMLTYFAW